MLVFSQTPQPPSALPPGGCRIQSPLVPPPPPAQEETCHLSPGLLQLTSWPLPEENGENRNQITSFPCSKPSTGCPGASDGKESACSAGHLGLTSASGRSPGEGNVYPLQCSCLENAMDRGAGRAAVHGLAESDTTE